MVTSRCKHRNATVIAWTEGLAQIEVKDGEPKAIGSSPPLIVAASVDCHECGLSRTYRKIPKWLDPILDVAEY